MLCHDLSPARTKQFALSLSLSFSRSLARPPASGCTSTALLTHPSRASSSPTHTTLIARAPPTHSTVVARAIARKAALMHAMQSFQPQTPCCRFPAPLLCFVSKVKAAGQTEVEREQVRALFRPALVPSFARPLDRSSRCCCCCSSSFCASSSFLSIQQSIYLCCGRRSVGKCSAGTGSDSLALALARSTAAPLPRAENFGPARTGRQPKSKT